jgi:hypothetical protein|tara:strand:+ start:746 stop:1183 length:438 start_codon:yes stop_codon:yes gene_type:complete
MSNKSSEKNIYKKKEDFTWTEVDVEKNGKTTRIVVPDGKIGYGDSESQALITGDLADKHSDDSKAGEKAYEQAREQLDQDWQAKRKAIKMQELKSRMPLMKQFAITDETGEIIQYEFHFMKTDENGLQYPLKKIVDAQTGKVRNG